MEIDSKCNMAYDFHYHMGGTMKIKIILPFFALTALLVSCGTMSHTALFKPGVSLAQKQGDLDRCKIASFKQVPAELSTSVSGGFYDPGYISCVGTGGGGAFCRRVGGVYIPPTYSTVDRNENLRWRYVQGCLQQKGYDIVTNLRPCSNDAQRQQALAAKNINDLACNPDSSLDY